MTDCIFTKNKLDPDGYAKIGKNYKTFRLARYLYEEKYGKIEKGKVVDHLCRNRACVNIEHLEVVTIKENTRRGKSAKVTYEDVKKIKELYKAKLFNQMQLSHMYKIGQDQISRIINERRWA